MMKVPFWRQDSMIFPLSSVNNCEESVIYPICKLTGQPTVVLWLQQTCNSWIRDTGQLLLTTIGITWVSEFTLVLVAPVSTGQCKKRPDYTCTFNQILQKSRPEFRELWIFYAECSLLYAITKKVYFWHYSCYE